jgi:hypothetical protein
LHLSRIVLQIGKRYEIESSVSRQINENWPLGHESTGAGTLEQFFCVLRPFVVAREGPMPCALGD